MLHQETQANTSPPRDHRFRLIIACLAVILAVVVIYLLLSRKPSSTVTVTNNTGSTTLDSNQVNQIVVTLLAQTAIANANANAAANAAAAANANVTVNVNILTVTPSMPLPVTLIGIWSCSIDTTFVFQANGFALISGMGGSHSGTYVYDQNSSAFQFTGDAKYGVATYRILNLTAQQAVFMSTDGREVLNCNRTK